MIYYIHKEKGRIQMAEEEYVELVIKVPKEVALTKTYDKYFRCMSAKLDEVLYNAVELPENHGKLKDMGKLKYMFHLDSEQPIYSGKDIQWAINSMPTLIEANGIIENEISRHLNFDGKETEEDEKEM
jgi:hypothetical protein